MINFDLTTNEHRLVDKIVKRAMAISKRLALHWDETAVRMDITACHKNGCPLDLSRFANADDFNFAHDIFGIRNHINRRTGTIDGCFSPRFYTGENK